MPKESTNKGMGINIHVLSMRWKYEINEPLQVGEEQFFVSVKLLFFMYSFSLIILDIFVNYQEYDAFLP